MIISQFLACFATLSIAISFPQLFYYSWLWAISEFFF